MGTIKQITYETNNQAVFVHDSTEILIDVNGAAFKLLTLQNNELFVATRRLGTPADRAIGSLTGTASNGATSTTFGGEEYYDVSGQVVGRTWRFDGASANFGDTGTIRFKIVPQYSGTPSANRFMFLIAGSSGANDISFFHKSDGTISARFNDSSGSLVADVTFGGAVYNPTSGQEEEVELNIDTSVSNSIGLFFDGVPFGSLGNVSTSRGPVTDIYMGSPIGTSDYLIRDFQIFDTVQHTSDFTGEIPRVVALYPSLSKIIPAEDSEAEGFDSVFQSISQLENGSGVGYQMKIGNDFYYLVGPILTLIVNDTSTTTPADWTSNASVVTSFISSGIAITMVPVLNSGPDQIGNLLLASTTLEYDFFAILGDCDVCLLFGFVNDNCNDIASGTVRVFTSKPINTQGTITAFDDTVSIRLLDGFFEIDLIIPNLPLVSGRQDDFYRFEAKWIDDDGKSWSVSKKILIPNQATVLYDEDIIV